jgi:D-psicose/D-tagatose/L-ribulose 3-epimerase
MKTGFNLLLWTTHVTDAHLPLLEKLKRAGYDGVEIPLFEGEIGHYRRLARAIADQGLCCTTVTVLPDDRHSAIHRQAAELAAAAGLVLAIEPLNRFECYFLNTMADTRAHVQRVGQPNFGALYDTFHANIEEQDPLGAIAACADVIRHVHVSENDRGTPGKGHIDFGASFRALRAAGYDGWLTVEAFGTALPALAAATKVWRSFFPTTEEVYEIGIKTVRDAWAAAG